MNNKLVPKSKTFDCPTCKRQVTFRYLERQFSVDELGVVDYNIDKITDYGRCEVSEKAMPPGHPIHPDLEKGCGFYQALNAKKI
jgi:hypothetical protein